MVAENVKTPVKPAKSKRRFYLIIGFVALALVGALAGIAAAFQNHGLIGTAVSRQNLFYKSAGGTSGTAVMMAPSAMPEAAFDSGVTNSYGGEIAAMPLVVEPRGGQTAAEVDQKIIKNGSLSLTVKGVGEAAAQITALAAGRGGFVQSSSVEERADGTHYGNITIRIPTKEFEGTMTDIRKLAIVVKSETASGQDVTEQYTDLEARLVNAQAQEKQYLAVLDRAKTVEDILKVQDYLGRVRQEIEQLQGQLKYLENVTAYSTVACYLEEEPVVQLPTKEFRPLTSLKAAAQSLVEVFQETAVALIWIIIVGGGTLLPLALLALVVWLIVRAVRRRPKK